MPGPRVLLIDNDDSYTYNLFHLIGALTGRPPHVVGHDDPVDPRRYSHLVISPGPGHPAARRRVGRLAELIMTTDRPVLGVCLGHQLLGLVFGGSVVRVEPHHGLISAVRHDGRGVFAGLPQDFRAVRYHSLAVVDPPPDLEVTATAADDGVIMGLRHRTRDLHGVQFHPESIAAESGRELMINFLDRPTPPDPVERHLPRALSPSKGITSRPGPVEGHPPPRREPVEGHQPPCPEPVEGHHIAPAGSPSGTSHALRQAQGTEGTDLGTERETTGMEGESLGTNGESLGKEGESPGKEGEALGTEGEVPGTGAQGTPSDELRARRARLRARGYGARRSAGAERDGARLLTRELPWREPEDVFVAHYADRSTTCWLDSGVGGRYSIMGAPESPRGVVLSSAGLSGRDLLTRLSEGIAETRIDPADAPFPFRGGYVGYHGYPAADGTTEAEFAYLERFLVFDHEHLRIHAAAVARPGEEQEAGLWLDRTTARIAATTPADEPSRQGILGPITDPDPAWYPAAYDRVQSYLRSGDSYEVNLTFQRRIAYHGDHVDLYRELRRANPAPYAAFLRLPSATVLSSSPERFLRVDDRGLVQARPIKGTAPRHADPAIDAVIKDRLRTETKTVAENLMITDLLRHDLGRSCRLGSVRVPELMAVESYRTVHQLVTTVEGELDEGVDAVGCVTAALPPGSMTGAPKSRTLEIIDEVECSPRGIYSGVLGYFSLSGEADLSVIIRTIVARGDELSIGVGGGVIALSDRDDEYAEALLKSEALLDAIRSSCRVPAATP